MRTQPYVYCSCYQHVRRIDTLALVIMLNKNGRERGREKGRVGRISLGVAGSSKMNEFFLLGIGIKIAIKGGIERSAREQRTTERFRR